MLAYHSIQFKPRHWKYLNYLVSHYLKLLLKIIAVWIQKGLNYTFEHIMNNQTGCWRMHLYENIIFFTPKFLCEFVKTELIHQWTKTLAEPGKWTFGQQSLRKITIFQLFLSWNVGWYWKRSDYSDLCQFEHFFQLILQNLSTHLNILRYEFIVFVSLSGRHAFISWKKIVQYFAGFELLLSLKFFHFLLFPRSKIDKIS